MSSMLMRKMLPGSLTGTARPLECSAAVLQWQRWYRSGSLAWDVFLDVVGPDLGAVDVAVVVDGDTFGAARAAPLGRVGNKPGHRTVGGASDPDTST